MMITEITLKLAKLLDRANAVPAHHSSRYAQGVVDGQGVQVWMLNGGYQVWVLRITGSQPLTISEAAEVIATASREAERQAERDPLAQLLNSTSVEEAAGLASWGA